jgi:hypothetical protein
MCSVEHADDNAKELGYSGHDSGLLHLSYPMLAICSHGATSCWNSAGVVWVRSGRTARAPVARERAADRQGTCQEVSFLSPTAPDVFKVHAIILSNGCCLRIVSRHAELARGWLTCHYLESNTSELNCQNFDRGQRNVPRRFRSPPGKVWVVKDLVQVYGLAPQMHKRRDEIRRRLGNCPANGINKDCHQE